MALTAAGGASVGPSALVVVQLFNATETTTLVQLLMRAVSWQLMLYVDTIQSSQNSIKKSIIFLFVLVWNVQKTIMKNDPLSIFFPQGQDIESEYESEYMYEDSADDEDYMPPQKEKKVKEIW